MCRAYPRDISFLYCLFFSYRFTLSRDRLTYRTLVLLQSRSQGVIDGREEVHPLRRHSRASRVSTPHESVLDHVGVMGIVVDFEAKKRVGKGRWGVQDLSVLTVTAAGRAIGEDRRRPIL